MFGSCLKDRPLLVITDKLQIVNYDANPIQLQGGTKIFYIYTLKKYNKKLICIFVLKKYRYVSAIFN